MDEMNRTGWGPGAWDEEGDDAQWVDAETDLDCMIHRGPLGALCGYVGVPRTHPYYGLSYNDAATDSPAEINVHGGLTYADACHEGGTICHVPEPGREHDIWWFGFDTAHSQDYVPGMEAALRQIHEDLGRPTMPTISDPLGIWAKTYKDWAYVTEQCTNLAMQLKVAE